MDIFETILANEFLVKKNSSIFQVSDHEYSNWSELNKDRLSFWTKATDLFSESESLNDLKSEVILQIEKLIKRKNDDWILEKIFVQELKINLKQTRPPGFFEKIFKYRTINSLQKVISFYDQKRIYNRKHQSQFQLVRLYKRYNNKKMAILTLAKLYRSILDSNSNYLHSWIDYVFSDFSEFLNINLLDIVIELTPNMVYKQESLEIITNFLVKIEWNPENIFQLFGFISFFSINPESLGYKFKSVISTEQFIDNNLFEFVNFILAPEIVQKYKTVEYLLTYFQFFNSYILDNKTNFSFFQSVKEQNKTDLSNLLKSIFNLRKNYSPKEVIDFIYYFIPDFRTLNQYSFELGDLFTFVQANEIDFNFIELALKIIHSITMDPSFNQVIAEKTKTFLVDNSFSTDQFSIFLTNINIEEISFFFLNNELKLLLLNLIQTIFGNSTISSDFLKLKIAYLTSFSFLVTENEIKDIVLKLIEDNLSLSIPKRERLYNYIQISHMIEHYETFSTNDIIKLNLNELKTVLSVLYDASLKNYSFNPEFYFKGFAEVFRRNSSLNYVWIISIFGFQKLLPNVPDLNLKVIENYFNTLMNISTPSTTIRNEIKQLSIELIKFYSFNIKHTFIESLTNDFSPLSEANTIISTLVVNLIGNSLFNQKSIGILRSVNDLLYLSANLPTKTFANNTKVFTKIHYLITFDLLCNVIYTHGSLAPEDIKEIVKTKLIILRALGNISGRSHSKSSDKALILLKTFQRTYNSTDEDIIQLINSTPWKYSNLNQKFINNYDLREIPLFYGILRPGEYEKDVDNFTASHILDIGLSRFQFRSKENEIIKEILNNIAD